MKFKLHSPFQPTGDQPQAIKKLTQWVDSGKNDQTLLGVTGSGKTFTMAHVIEQTQKPTLIISHNKTLAAQLYQEFRDFFPNNAVNYFVSYYDYYQPEAYIASTDTYIEKEATINDEIDKLRLAATTNLLNRNDCIIVASVSCIYNLGSPVEYGQKTLEIIEGEIITRKILFSQVANLQYERSDIELRRGTFRIKGDTIQIWPAYEDVPITITTLENTIESIYWTDPVTGQKIDKPKHAASEISTHSSAPKRFMLYPAKHYITNEKTQEAGLKEIKKDMEKRVAFLKDMGKIVEAYRLEQKVNYDMDMIRELGFVNGIENYSRYFDGRSSGDPPYTLLDYLEHNAKKFSDGNFLTIIDESHMTIPQIRGMYAGDRSRKENLIEYGFRLPSALDNRPLRFEEFLNKTKQRMYVSATPEEWEIERSNTRVAEQLIRPTGLVDPDIEVRPIENQVPDLVKEIIRRKQKGQRVLVTTLTKKMSEALTQYLNDERKIRKIIHKMKINTDTEREEILPKVAYLHSDIETLERSDILSDLRKGEYDVLVGINLLREGLDLPEVTLVDILDADKQGFLRSRTSLIQTMGRAARHNEGHVIMYADKVSSAMREAMDEVERRREVQIAYNKKHNITPTTIAKPIRKELIGRKEREERGYKRRMNPGIMLKDRSPHTKRDHKTTLELTKKQSIVLEDIEPEALTPAQRKKLSSQLTRAMKRAANNMDFELAAQIRDVVRTLK